MKKMLITSLLVLFGMGLAQSGNFTNDPDHTSVAFRAGHLGIGYVYGVFNEAIANFEYDADTDTATSLEFFINPNSVHTANERRDGHLRSDDFFNVNQFPEISFVSSGITTVSEGMYEVTGDLTMKDVTMPMTIMVEKVGQGNGPQGNFRVGFSTMFTINRFDYNINFTEDIVDSDVVVMIAVEGILN